MGWVYFNFLCQSLPSTLQICTNWIMGNSVSHKSQGKSNERTRITLRGIVCSMQDDGGIHVCLCNNFLSFLWRRAKG